MLARKTQFDLLNFQACCSFKIQTVFFLISEKNWGIYNLRLPLFSFVWNFMDIFVYWKLFNWTVFWKVNRNKFRSLREIRGNVNWNFDLNFFYAKSFSQKNRQFSQLCIWFGVLKIHFESVYFLRTRHKGFMN